VITVRHVDDRVGGRHGHGVVGGRGAQAPGWTWPIEGSVSQPGPGVGAHPGSSV